MTAFDQVASRFERYRPLPGHVPAAIRLAFHDNAGIDAASRMLEVGCGTGRIGAPFSSAGDNYVGLDLSLEMLREFQQKNLTRRPNLVRADGCLLPFGDRIFAGVLMVHLTAVRNWRALLLEALRVLEADGVLAIGRAEGPADGIDATMRNRLNGLLAGLGMERGSWDRRAAADWLAAACSRRVEIIAAEWSVEQAPREFILRKESAADFSSLPANVRESALRSLADWTEQTIGPLDTPLHEPHHFSLKLHWFEAAAKHE